MLVLGNELVLFSGQQGIQRLEGLGTGELLFLAVAKWLALVIALVAGWRGGPVFPIYLAVSALVVAVIEPVLGPRTDLTVVAALAAVGVVFLNGKAPAGFLLTLYVAPFSYARARSWSAAWALRPHWRSPDRCACCPHPTSRRSNSSAGCARAGRDAARS